MNVVRLSVPALLLAAFILFSSRLSAQTLIDNEHHRGILQSEDMENPADRARLEWMMLRDPVSGKIPAGIHERELAFAQRLSMQSAKHDARFLSAGAYHTTTWNPSGPQTIGGRTRALAVDLENDGVILAGAASGGIWRSTDAGKSWTQTTAPSAIRNISCIAQDPRPGKQNIWYYGTGEGSPLVSSSATPKEPFVGDGIFKSTDRGMTWSRLPATSSGTPQALDNPFDIVWRIAVDPSNGQQDEVYAAVYGAIERSTDGGVTWKAVLGGKQPYSSFTDLCITSSGVVYATLSSDGSSGGIWRSADGVNWTKITSAAFPATFGRIVLDAAPSSDSILYFFAETPGFGRVIAARAWMPASNVSFWKYTYRSGDGSGSGGTWENRSDNIPEVVPQMGYCMMVKVKPDDPNMVFLGGIDLFRSTDGFATSTNYKMIGGSEYDPENHHSDQHAIAFIPGSPSMMYSAHDGGVSGTLDNTADSVGWIPFNNGYVTTQFYTIALDHGPQSFGDAWALGGLQDNGSCAGLILRDVQFWSEISGGDGSATAINNGDFYTAITNGSVFRIVGTINPQPYRIDPGIGSTLLALTMFALDPADRRVMYLAGNTDLWRNSDVTAIPFSPTYSPTTMNWTKLANTHLDNDGIFAIGIAKTPANRVYYGTINGKVFRLDNADQPSSKPVDVWSGKGFPAGGFVSCIAVDPRNGDRAVAVFTNYNVQSLFYTTDAGNRWAPIGGNLEEHPDGSGSGPYCRWLTIMPLGDSTIYFVGTSTGLYSTTTLDGMATVWHPEGETTIGNVPVDGIDARESDRVVVVATHGNGTFSSSVTTEQEARNFEAVLARSSFGNVPVNSSSYDTLYLSTSFISTASVSGSISLTSSAFAIDSGSTSFTISPEGDMRIRLRFTPKSSGTYIDTLFVTHDATNVPSTIKIVLRGSSGSSGVTATRMDGQTEISSSPNPSRSATSIHFITAESAEVTIDILTTDGKQIATLLHRQMEAGMHELNWNASAFSAGTYFLRIRCGDHETMQKLWLTK